MKKCHKLKSGSDCVFVKKEKKSFLIKAWDSNVEVSSADIWTIARLLTTVIQLMLFNA